MRTEMTGGEHGLGAQLNAFCCLSLCSSTSFRTQTKPEKTQNLSLLKSPFTSFFVHRFEKFQDHAHSFRLAYSFWSEISVQPMYVDAVIFIRVQSCNEKTKVQIHMFLFHQWRIQLQISCQLPRNVTIGLVLTPSSKGYAYLSKFAVNC